MAKPAFGIEESPESVEFTVGDKGMKLRKYGYFTVAEEIAWNTVGMNTQLDETQAEYEFNLVKALLPLRLGDLDCSIDTSLPYPQIHCLFEFLKGERDAGMPLIEIKSGGDEVAPKTP